MKEKIQKYLKHRFPIMADHLVEDIATELEVELSKEEQEKELTEADWKKIMDGDEKPSKKIDLKIG